MTLIPYQEPDFMATPSWSKTQGPPVFATAMPIRDQLNIDWINALEEEKARLADPRYLGAGINLDSPERIDAEIFAPLRARYGIPGGHVSSRVDATAPKFIPRGNAIVKVDPKTGTAEEIYHGEPATADIIERGLVTRKNLLESQLEGSKFADPAAIALGRSKNAKQLEAEWLKTDQQLRDYQKAKTGAPEPEVSLPMRKPTFFFGDSEEVPIPKSELTIKGGQVTQQAPSVSDELVPVINPQGKPVKIKASQLDDALTKGYRRR